MLAWVIEGNEDESQTLAQEGLILIWGIEFIKLKNLKILLAWVIEGNENEIFDVVTVRRIDDGLENFLRPFNRPCNVVGHTARCIDDKRDRSIRI